MQNRTQTVPSIRHDIQGCSVLVFPLTFFEGSWTNIQIHPSFCGLKLESGERLGPKVWNSHQGRSINTSHDAFRASRTAGDPEP